MVKEETKYTSKRDRESDERDRADRVHEREIKRMRNEATELQNQYNIISDQLAECVTVNATLKADLALLEQSIQAQLDDLAASLHNAHALQLNTALEGKIDQYIYDNDMERSEQRSKALEESNQDLQKKIKVLEEKNKNLKESNESKSDRLSNTPTAYNYIEEFANDLIALRDSCNTHAPNPDDLASFRHEKYVMENIEIINQRNANDDSKKVKNLNIITFLQEVLERTLLKLEVPNVDNNFKYLSTCISALVKAIQPKYISTATYLTIINILSISKSALCADFVNWAMCGGVTSQSIYNTFTKLGEIFSKSKVVCPMDYEVIAVFDNNSNDYKRKTYRSGLNQNKSTLVWTNVEAYLFSRCDKTSKATINSKNGILCLQNDQKLSPQQWMNFDKKTLVQSDNSIIDVTTFDDDNIPNRTDINPDTLSDNIYIKNEMKRGLAFAIMLIHDVPELTSYYKSSNKVTIRGSRYSDDGADDEADNKMQIKTCYSCGTLNTKFLRYCHLCSRKLLKISEYRQVYSNNNTLEQLMKPPPLRRYRKTSTKLMTLGPSNEIIRTSVSTSNHTLSVPLDKDDVYENDERESASEYFINIIRELLPSICVNPSGDNEIKKIYSKLGETFNLVGFIQQGSLDSAEIRYFLYLVSDFGATYLKLIDTDPLYQNFIHVIGTFHECKAFLELTMDLLFSIGGDLLAVRHTFGSEKAQAYLRRCGDLHKANDFLRDVVKPALHICVIFEYLIETKGDSPDFSSVDLDDVYKWGNDYYDNSNIEDLRWKNFWFFFCHILPAYELIKKGVRSGDMEAYNCGRRALLPFLFSLSKTNYGPLILRDMIQYYWKAPHEIRVQLNEIFCLYDEGINGKMEESNKAQKSFTLSDTKSGIQSGALLCNLSESLRNGMVYLKGDKGNNEVKDTIPERRVPSDLDSDIVSCVELLMNHRIFQKNNKKTSAGRFDNTYIKVPVVNNNADMSLINLYRVGIEEKRKYYDKYVRSPSLELPSCERVYTFRKTKTVVDLEGYTQIVSDNEDGDDEIL